MEREPLLTISLARGLQKAASAKTPVSDVQSLKDAKKVLCPGDILVTHGKDKSLRGRLLGKALELGQGTPYYHSAMYVGGGKVIHSRMGEGVTKLPLSKIHKMYDYRIYRVNADEKERGEAADYAKTTVGRGYSKKKLLGTFLPGLYGKQSKAERLKARGNQDLVCSELIAAAYPNKRFGGRAVEAVRPVDFARSSSTKLVAATPRSWEMKEKTAGYSVNPLVREVWATSVRPSIEGLNLSKTKGLLGRTGQLLKGSRRDALKGYQQRVEGGLGAIEDFGAKLRKDLGEVDLNKPLDQSKDELYDVLHGLDLGRNSLLRARVGARDALADEARKVLAARVGAGGVAAVPLGVGTAVALNGGTEKTAGTDDAGPKDMGFYKGEPTSPHTVKFKTEFQGIPINVDRPRGFIMKGKDSKGQDWARRYRYDYGFIPKTLGGDDDGLDVFIGPSKKHEYAYWAVQRKDDGSFDEYKVFLGFPDRDAAIAAYRQHIPKKYFKGMITMKVEMMKAMLGKVNPNEKIKRAAANGFMDELAWLTAASRG